MAAPWPNQRSNRRFVVNRIVCVVVAVLLPGGVSPQQRSDARDSVPVFAAADSTLRLGELYVIAARANPRVRAATAVADATDAALPSTTRPPDPRVQFALMNRELPGFAPMNPLGMTQVQVMQMIPTAGKLAYGSRAAQSRAVGVRLRATELSWEVRRQVAAAFYETYRVERATTIALETRRFLVGVTETAEAMYRVGEAPQADVLKAQVEVAMLTEEIIALQALRRVALARLGGLIDQRVDSTTPPAGLPMFPPDVPPLDSLERLAVSERAMVKAGEAELSAMEFERALAYREIWPDLEIGVQYGQRSDGMGTERMASLMVGASLPIFASRRQLPMRESATAMRAMATADLAAMRADTRAMVGVAHAEWRRARSLQQLYRGTVLPQARAAVMSALAAYRVGGVNLMTLLDGQAAVNRFEQELAALEAMEGIVIAELEMLLGRNLLDLATRPSETRSPR